MRNQEIGVDNVKWRRNGAKSAAFITFRFLSFNNFFSFFFFLRDCLYLAQFFSTQIQFVIDAVC